MKLMNTEITKVTEWLRINKLSLYLKKTHFMVFRKSRRKIELKKDVIIDNVKIDFVTQTKFLGVILDQDLTFKWHVQYTKGEIARDIGILYRAKKYLKESSMKTLYYAFICPYFTYCITGATLSTQSSSLWLCYKKRAVRVVCGAQKFDHTYSLFQLSKILPLRNLNVYFAQLFLYKYYRQSLPNIFLVSSPSMKQSIFITQGKLNIFILTLPNHLKGQEHCYALV